MKLKPLAGVTDFERYEFLQVYANSKSGSNYAKAKWMYAPTETVLPK